RAPERRRAGPETQGKRPGRDLGRRRLPEEITPERLMIEGEFVIPNKLGLHARASALLVKTASRYDSEIRIEREGVEVNGKSIMGIMMLAAAKGSSIKLKVEGPDDAEAFAALGELIRNGFGEE